jgi:23S rRNA (cytosine1962-C5)-methyltransferase
LRVTATAESVLRSGHPWLFADSILRQSREGQLGEIGIVYDRKDRFLALGLFEPESPIRLRVLHVGAPEELDKGWWNRRLHQALQRRHGLFDEQTTGFRLINGESDGWPGLVLDQYGGTLVLKLYTGSWLPRLDEIARLIDQHLNPERLVLRLSRNLQPLAQNSFSRRDGDLLQGQTILGPVFFLETGIRFEADVLRGQKTGFFLDQRENRRKVEGLARARTVLNAFSFSGGFSVYSARGGAEQVADLDISAHALAASERNFAINNSCVAIAHCRKERIQADAFDWLAANSERKFELIVLDPPSLAKRESEKAGAIQAYKRLLGLGLKHLSRRGILVASSCSAHVSAEEFFGAVREIARKSGRGFQEMETTWHPPDHPATFKEADYLKAIYLRF